MANTQTGEHGVLTNNGFNEFFDGGCESFTDAIEEMMCLGRALPSRSRATIAEWGYRNAVGGAYMTAVGFYDEDTGEAWEAMTLAEAIEALKAAEDEEE